MVYLLLERMLFLEPMLKMRLAMQQEQFTTLNILTDRTGFNNRSYLLGMVLQKTDSVTV